MRLATTIAALALLCGGCVTETPREAWLKRDMDWISFTVTVAESDLVKIDRAHRRFWISTEDYSVRTAALEQRISELSVEYREHEAELASLRD